MDEEVTISAKEYAKLQRDSEWLSCLEAAGVDNWPGIDYAAEIYREANPDEDED